VIADYEAKLATARKEAAAIAQATRNEVMGKLDAERAQVEQKLAAKVAEAEARISASKQKALADVTGVAEAAAAEIIANLTGGKVSAADAAKAQSGEPIKIGFSMSLTGPLSPNGKQALLGLQIWEEEVNARGGMLGRPVKLVFYDDQSNPSTVPGIYTKLLDVDKVDIAVSGYATNMVAPAMPIMMQRKKTFLALFGLAVKP